MGHVFHILEQGSKIIKESERLYVKKDEEILAEIRTFDLDAIFIYGGVQISTQALRLIMEKGIDCSILTMDGRLIGTINSIKSKNIVRRVNQYRKCVDNDSRIYIAKKLVIAKLRNMIYLIKIYLKNWYDRDIALVIKDIDSGISALVRKNSVNRILGVEGYITSCYFRAYRKMFRGELKFESRTRRPPKDPVNAMLGFGYTYLMNQFITLLNSFGLDPYLGFYHGVQYGRPSLALDMMENFRSVVDRMVLKLCNLKVFGYNDFEERDNGVYLTQKGLKKYLKECEKYFKENSYKDMMYTQVESLSRYLKDGSDFEPVIFE